VPIVSTWGPPPTRPATSTTPTRPNTQPHR
jgi:hypothetical protein